LVLAAAALALSACGSSGESKKDFIARADAIFYAKATGVGNPIVYLGSKTGRDGIHVGPSAKAR